MKNSTPRPPKNTEPFSQEIILRGLGTKTFGRPTLCLESVSSTNDTALLLAQEGAPEGAVVTAEVQTNGRGRQGRRWVVKQGKSLAFSIILKPKLPLDEISEITLAAAVAVAWTLEAYRIHPKIKWPNDLLLEGKKVCGILTELGAKKDKISPVILGIGINLNQVPGDFPKDLRENATSLRIFSRKKINRAVFFQRLLLNLEDTYRKVTERKFPKVLGEWKKRNVTLGSQVRVSQAHRDFYGQAVDLDEKGALLIRTDVGVVERITSGDVEILRLRKRKRRS